MVGVPLQVELEDELLVVVVPVLAGLVVDVAGAPEPHPASTSTAQAAPAAKSLCCLSPIEADGSLCQLPRRA
ncbi:MAG: hypothetical protein ACR2MK_04555 [Solirubrobacteraceae bacterium]